MSSHILKTVEELETKLSEQAAAVSTTKKLINQLLEMAHQPPRYVVDDDPSSRPNLSIRSDQFYGQPLATNVREILAMRKALNQGPATINEIYAALQEGGFAFDAKDDDNAKRGLRISITKNTALFHKLPTGKIGLLEWYPNAKTAKARRSKEANIWDGSDEDPFKDGGKDDGEE